MDGQTLEMQESWETPVQDSELMTEALDEMLERNFSFDVRDEMAILRAKLAEIRDDARVGSMIILDELDDAIQTLDTIDVHLDEALCDQYEEGYNDGLDARR